MPSTVATKSETKTHLYTSKIDLSEATRTKIIEILNKSLATSMDLKTQIKQAHWTVKGKDFYSLHLLFDTLAAEMETTVDTVAERVSALGGRPHGTARSAAESSILPEYPNVTEGLEHIRALSERYAMYGKHVREAIDEADSIGDKGTADMYTAISRQTDMRLWFLEAHIQA